MRRRSSISEQKVFSILFLNLYKLKLWVYYRRTSWNLFFCLLPINTLIQVVNCSSNFLAVLCGRLIKSCTLSRELKQSLWVLIVWFTHTLDQSDSLNSCCLLQNFTIIMFINTPFSRPLYPSAHPNMCAKKWQLLIFRGVFRCLLTLLLLKKPSRSIRRDKEKVLSLGHKTNQKLTNLNKKLPRYPFA